MKSAFLPLFAALLLLPFQFGAAENGEYALLKENGDYKLETADLEPPAEVAAEIRAEIAPKAYRISGPDGVRFEFWFAKELKAASIPEDKHKRLDGIVPVSLLGAAIVHGEERNIDFREDPLDPGTYTMRMGTQPQDGDHMGTAPTNTFAILIFADRDKGLAAFPDHEEMIDTSREGTIAEHPPILYMQADEDDATEYPRLDLSGEGKREWQVLAMKLPVDVNGEKKEVAFQLVFEGLGDL